MSRQTVDTLGWNRIPACAVELGMPTRRQIWMRALGWVGFTIQEVDADTHSMVGGAWVSASVLGKVSVW